MTAKIEFLQLREDPRLEADLTKRSIGKLWANTGI